MPGILEATRDLSTRQKVAAAEPVVLAAIIVFTVWKWTRQRSVLIRLADARIPHNALLLGLVASRLRRYEMRRPFADLGYAMSELANLLNEQMKQSEQRGREEVQLQVSLEAFARAAEARDQRVSALRESVEELSLAADARDWRMLTLHKQIVRFTYVLALLGASTIGVTIWLALR